MRPGWNGQLAHRRWLTLSLIGALALLTACTGTTVVGHPTPSATAAATATATVTLLPAMPLSWQAGTLPPGGPVFGSFNGPVTVATGDGRVAYALRVVQNGVQVQNPEVWVTHDRAVHWTRMADVPAGRSYTFAWLVVDNIDPAIVVAVVSWAQSKLGPLPEFSANYVTFDGGATWKRLSGSQPFEVGWHATRNGTTFAILNSGADGGGDIRPWVSTDGMRTWQPVAGPNAFAIASFWINPASGEILATVGDPEQLWETPDEGQRWSQLTIPALDPTSFIVGPPVAGQPWRMCGLTPHPDNPDGGTLMCSLDGGQTWQERPRIRYTESGPKGSFPAVAGLQGVAGDGTLLGGGPDPNALYQLKPGASAWQSLGPESQAPLATAALPNGGMLWEWAANPGNDVSGPYPAG